MEFTTSIYKNKTPQSLPCSAKAAYCARRILKTCFSFLSIRTLSFRKPCADPAHLLQPYLHRRLHPSRPGMGLGQAAGVCLCPATSSTLYKSLTSLLSLLPVHLVVIFGCTYHGGNILIKNSFYEGKETNKSLWRYFQENYSNA